MAIRSVRSIEDMKSRCIINENGCWIWLGSKCGPGYGECWDYRIKRKIMAHRLAFSFSKGDIPSHLEIDHICNVRQCINPNHLQLLSHADNCKRRDSNKTHCKQGHPWIAENIYTFGKSRVCKICSKQRVKEWCARNHDKALAISRRYYNSVTKIRNQELRLAKVKRLGTEKKGTSSEVCVPEISISCPKTDVTIANFHS